MKNKLLHKVLISLIPVLIISCESETGWNLQEGKEFIVADCIITNELRYHELKLYWSSSVLNHVPDAFSGAVIELNDGSSSISFAEDTEIPGRYISTISFMASAGKVYRMAISGDNFADTAYASMMGVSPLEEIDIKASDGYFRLIYHESVQASMTEVLYDWSSDALYCEQYGNCSASETFYSLDNIDVGRQFAPEKQVIRFPHSTRIIRRKYSLSEEHQQFLRSLLLETEWRGGIFDVEQGNIPTNFQHGLRGWFAACMVLSDTTYFE